MSSFHSIHTEYPTSIWWQQIIFNLLKTTTNLRFGYKTTHLQVYIDIIAACSETRNSTHDCILWAEGGDFFISNLMIQWREFISMFLLSYSFSRHQIQNTQPKHISQIPKLLT